MVISCVKVSLATPLIDVLDLLIERRLSVVPVLDSEGRVVNVYGKFDVMVSLL